jgi:cytochrome P450
LTVETAGLRLLEEETHTDAAFAHRVCTLLRNHDPIHFVDHPDFPQLWALTRRADVKEIEQHADVWAQGRNPFLARRAQNRFVVERGRPLLGRMLIDFNGEEHAALRSLTASWFTPKQLANVRVRLPQFAKDVVDQMADADGTCDFAELVCWYPLRLNLDILGVPECDHEWILDISGGRLGDRGAAEDTRVAKLAARFNSFDRYSWDLYADRRANPCDVLATVIATAGPPAADFLGDAETFGYGAILSIARHDSTTSSLVGGIHALAMFPDQLARLRQDPSLVATAADEFIRWVTPVKHFTRTAVRRYRLRDQQFEIGDLVYLSYLGANFDPAVFDEPFCFDVGRSPNPHLALGFGAHFCLGAQLARMEIRAFLDEMLPRVRSIEIAGPTPLRPIGGGIGGYTSMPISYELT